MISTRRNKEHKRIKDTAHAIAVARYVLTDDAQRELLSVIWGELLPSWRDRVLKSIRSAVKLHPMEEGVLESLVAFLAGMKP